MLEPKLDFEPIIYTVYYLAHSIKIFPSHIWLAGNWW